MWAAWRDLREAVRDHPFYARTEARAAKDPGYVLRCYVTLFAARTAMLRPLYLHDLYRHDLDGLPDSDDPHIADHQRVNLLCRMLATEPVGLLEDWNVLGLDRRLGWSMQDSLRFWFLDERWMADEMAALHAVRRQAHAAVHHPALRYWFMNGIDAIGDVVFNLTYPIALAYQEREGGRWPLYMGGEHHLLYETVRKDWRTCIEPSDLTEAPLSADAEAQALQILTVIRHRLLPQFDKLVELLDSSASSVRDALAGE